MPGRHTSLSPTEGQAARRALLGKRALPEVYKRALPEVYKRALPEVYKRALPEVYLMSVHPV